MWNGHKVAYVCAMYFGSRRKQKHGQKNNFISFFMTPLLKHSTCIDSIVIGCNLDPGHEEDYEKFLRRVEGFRKKSDIPITTFSRPNQNYSYGVWDEALRDHCEGIDFAFLLEDDYCVCKPGYDAECLDRYFSTPESLDELLYCASWWDKGHASISNGIINLRVFHAHGGQLYLWPHDRNHGPKTQHTYLDPFMSKGLSVRDMAVEYCMPFTHHTDKIEYFGNPDGPMVFMPCELTKRELQTQQAKEHSFPAELPTANDRGFYVLRGGASFEEK